MDQIFNELSVQAAYPDRHSASSGMERVLQVSQELRRTGFTGAVRTTRDFSQRKIAEEYTVHDWAVDFSLAEANRDLKRRFLTYASKSPYVEDFIDTFEDNGKLVDFRFLDTKALGLGLAFLWNIPVLCLDCDERFTADHVRLIYTSVTDSGEKTEEVEVLTLSGVPQVYRFEPLLRDRLRADVENGPDLLGKSRRLLPHLSLSDRATDQIKELTGHELYFPELTRHLFVLNDTMGRWNAGPFEPQGIVWSTESASTLQEFGDCRIFVCADELERAFSCHTKILSANKRIYFYPICESRTVHIGHVGNHLPTTRFRT